MSNFWSDPSARLDHAPSKRRRFRKRWIVFGLVGAFVLLMILVPKRTPQQIAADKAEAAAADAQAAASKAQASATAKATLTGETKALWDRLIEATGPCDRAGEQVAAAGKAGDRYALYSAAKAGEEACRDSYSAVHGLDAPASSAGDVEEAFEKAIDSCGSAQTARILAFEKIATVADGDMRPSAVQDAREWTEYAGKGSLACAAGMYVAAGKGGVDPSIFGKAKP